MVRGEVKRAFNPEFLNRLDDIIVFRSLTDEDLRQIVDIELAKLMKRLKEKNLSIILGDDAKDVIIKRGANREFGARPLRRAIENMLEDPLSEKMLRGDFVGKTMIYAKVVEVDGEKKIEFEAKESATPELVGAAGAEKKA
jgi:ATP-dependent Clp protease ATP-binding subunit ClpC